MKTNYKQKIINEIYRNKHKKEIPLDNSVVENHFVCDDSLRGLLYSPTIEEELESTKRDKIQAIREIIDFNLPQLEKKIIQRIFFDDMKQEGIARLFQISQEMVSYYKHRAVQRIQYYLKTKDICMASMRKCLEKIVTRKQCDAMIMYYKIHNQNIVANHFNVTQSAISSRLKLGLKQLGIASQNNVQYQKYYEIFKFLYEYNSLQSSQVRIISNN